MNKRIEELYKLATGKDWAYDFDPAIAEKFAELIVRQTMDYASRNWEHGHLLAEDLKVYFGVE